MVPTDSSEYKDFSEDATHGLLSGVDVGTCGTTKPQAIRFT